MEVHNHRICFCVHSCMCVKDLIDASFTVVSMMCLNTGSQARSVSRMRDIPNASLGLVDSLCGPLRYWVISPSRGLIISYSAPAISTLLLFAFM